MNNYMSRYTYGVLFLVAIMDGNGQLRAMDKMLRKEEHIEPIWRNATHQLQSDVSGKPRSWNDVLSTILKTRCSQELWSAYKSDAARLVLLGASPDLSDEHGSTLFNKAVGFDDLEYVGFLIAMLEQYEKKDESLLFNPHVHEDTGYRLGASPFFDVKSKEMMEKLLQAGGDVNFVGAVGSALEGRSLLHAACAPDVPVEVVVLAAESMTPEAKASCASNGNTPLHELVLQSSFYGDGRCGDLCKKGEVLVRHIPVESKNADGLMAVQLLEVAPEERAISKKMLRLLLESEHAKKPWYKKMLSGWW